jgi:hypothetical protein
MTPRTRAYRLHGLQIVSEVELHERPAEGGRVDVRFRVGDSIAVPAKPPPGTLIAQFSLDGEPLYSGTRLEDGSHVLRVHGLCDFVIEQGGATVVCQPDPAADPGYLPILLRGTLLSFLLGISGASVLHASAVEIDGAAIAFVGMSGSGKSTMAALLCSDGARLISDDVLRVEVAGNRPICLCGSTELRLRPAAADILERFSPAPPSRVVADGRLAVNPPLVASDRMRLGAIIVPLPSRSCSTLKLHQQAPVDAIFSLVRFPRIAGWRSPELLQNQFDVLTRLGSDVPVFHAVVPWGPPWPTGLSRELSQAVMGATV